MVLLMNKYIKSGAIFSKCRKYRYVLRRVWDNKKNTVNFIGLNPSTANELDDDPTIRRCVNYAKAWDYGGIFMLNIFAFRATDPKIMQEARTPIGKLNDFYLKKCCNLMGSITIACWGVHGVYLGRNIEVRNLIPSLLCLGKTKDGHPKHPLYLKKDLKPVRYYG